MHEQHSNLILSLHCSLSFYEFVVVVVCFA